MRKGRPKTMKETCTKCGAGEVKAKNLCNPCYMAAYRSGDMESVDLKDSERFRDGYSYVKGLLETKLQESSQVKFSELFYQAGQFGRILDEILGSLEVDLKFRRIEKGFITYIEPMPREEIERREARQAWMKRDENAKVFSLRKAA